MCSYAELFLCERAPGTTVALVVLGGGRAWISCPPVLGHAFLPRLRVSARALFRLRAPAER